MMEKLKIFFSKHGLLIFVLMFFVMFVQNCTKNSQIKKLQKEKTNCIEQKDSLNNLVISPMNLEKIKNGAKLEILNYLNDEASKLDRSSQMMNFQKDHIIGPKKELEEKIK
jgi:hypothetical protein